MVSSWRLLLVSALAGPSLAHSGAAPADGQLQAPNHAPKGHSRLALTDSVKEYIEKELARYGVRGMSIAVVHTDWPTEGSNNFGNSATVGTEYANFGIRSEDGDPMTGDTYFTIASNTKAFVTAGIGLLIEDFAQKNNRTALPVGVVRLDWDTKLANLLPGQWALMDEWASHGAKLKDIFSHVSGLPRHDYAYSRNDTSASVLSRIRDLRPAFELRERYSYSNIMFMVGQHIIDTYSGTSMERYLHDRIFAPLNTTFTFSPAQALESGRATQTWSKDGRALPWCFTEADYKVAAGPAGLIADVKGLSRWIAMFLNNGINAATQREVLPAKLVKALTTARVIDGGKGKDTQSISGYALGWRRLSYRGHDIIHHGGSANGFSSLILFAPHDHVGVIILNNGDQQADANTRIAWRLFETAFGLEPLDGEEPENPSDLLVSDERRAPAFSPSLEEDTHASDSFTSLDIRSLEGTYAAPGYGAGFELCSASSTSEPCREVLADFSAVDGQLREDNLYASWPRLWSSHLRLVRVNGARFAFRPGSLYPHGYGLNRTAFETCELECGQGGNAPWADFVIEGDNVIGFGLRGSLGDEKTMLEKEGGSVQERADAWFARSSSVYALLVAGFDA
ncbi:beta-lactamase/transpeptidase-like protein [Peniophora sp. CONT]|nr:beta-lactamase/transpeptidase-like protein [Peniophora sp. CONT]